MSFMGHQITNVNGWVRIEFQWPNLTNAFGQESPINLSNTCNRNENNLDQPDKNECGRKDKTKGNSTGNERLWVRLSLWVQENRTGACQHLLCPFQGEE